MILVKKKQEMVKKLEDGDIEETMILTERKAKAKKIKSFNYSN